MMGRESRAIAVLVCALVIACAIAAVPYVHAQSKPAAGGWTLPPDADTVKNPLTVDDKVLANGKAVFKEKCEKCHGPAGLGDGPDADPDAMMDMDLTVAKRAARNPDGVVFYKVMNGRRKPKMPAFKEELTTDQVWSVVAYAQSLRKAK
jgi:mono/diheme cytochrome c family protein